MIILDTLTSVHLDTKKWTNNDSNFWELPACDVQKIISTVEARFFEAGYTNESPDEAPCLKLVDDIAVHTSFSEISIDMCTCLNSIPPTIVVDDLLNCEVTYDDFSDTGFHVQEVCRSQTETEVRSRKILY